MLTLLIFYFISALFQSSKIILNSLILLNNSNTDFQYSVL